MLRIFRHADLHRVAGLAPVVAIGNFDGVHLGHQKLLAACTAKARELGAPAAVLTFSPHPRHYFNPSSPLPSLYRLRKKAQLLSEQGVDLLCIARFDAHMAQMSAQDFIETILRKKLGARHVLTGSNFVFGAKRGGSTHTLAQAAQAGAFGYSAVEPFLCPTQKVCSSSRIREHLAAGEVPIAGALLGRPYSIGGHVRHGDGRGRGLGFPTLNLALGGLFLPAFGVYAATVHVENGSGNLPAVVNLGVRPTFGASQPVLEAHLLAEGDDYYGTRVEVTLHRFLRAEQRFDSPEALREQIARDCQSAHHILAGIAS